MAHNFCCILLVKSSKKAMKVKKQTPSLEGRCCKVTLQGHGHRERKNLYCFCKLPQVMSNRRKKLLTSPFRRELSFGKFPITKMSSSELKFLYCMIVIDDFLTVFASGIRRLEAVMLLR